MNKINVKRIFQCEFCDQKFSALEEIIDEEIFQENNRIDPEHFFTLIENDVKRNYWITMDICNNCF